MQEVNRRNFLAFVGGAGATASFAGLGSLLPAGSAHAAPIVLNFTPVRVPFPLPIYTTNNNFLPTGLNGVGTAVASIESGGSTPMNLLNYTVIDDVVVPPEYERYVISSWGDRPFGNTAYSTTSDYVGFNCDYTGYIPLAGTNDGLLWQNHEYTSYPFSEITPESAITSPAGNNVFQRVIGYAIPTTRTRGYMGESLYNVGGSILRIKRVTRGGRFAVENGDVRNRRIHALSGLGVNSLRTDAYYTAALPATTVVGVAPNQTTVVTNQRATTQYSQVTSFGALQHQVGDNNYLVGTGPAVADVFVGVNADTLGNKIIGTLGNCSGGTTPWGTILSCEENFQADPGSFFLGVTETVRPNGSQTGYGSTGVQTEVGSRTAGAEFGLVGEKYGWVVEIDVKDATQRAKKHTAMGRFRHENVALRVEAGQKLAAYMGDDRRGGHTWKYVSDSVVNNVTAPTNSALFESGTLYVAKFNADGTGQWIPLTMTTATNPNSPTAISSVQFAAEGVRDNFGRVRLPLRTGTPGVAAVTAAPGVPAVTGVTPANGGSAIVDTTNEATVLPFYTSKFLSNFYDNQGAILVDAFQAANLVGGTPGARPEDIEVHPKTKAVYVAYTDGRSGGDGYSDSRIFTVSKYTTAVTAASQNGGLYKIEENGNAPDALSFTWSKFLQAGEAGAVDGAGFGNLDNLAFDSKFNVWGVMDMSTDLHNGLGLGITPTVRVINHALAGSANAQPTVGVFGNNWMFCIPTEGPDAGKQLPFAIGPTRAEMTGPTFVGDHLILAIQHPGENAPIDLQNTGPITRSIEMLAIDGSLFNQSRTIPFGSQWPSNTIAGNTSGIPKPSVIGIRRKTGGAFI